MQAWWMVAEKKPFTDGAPSDEERRDGWRKAVNGRRVEIGWLSRKAVGRIRYEELTLTQLGL
jgi:hypothetical protein